MTEGSFAGDVPEVVAPDTKPSRGGLRDILSIFGVLASALLLAFVLISFVFQSYQVDGPSMQTTLEDNDHLIVWKVPKTIAKVTGSHYIPKRGDIVVLDSVIDGRPEQLIKRVVALPGERVVVYNGTVTVYDRQHPGGFDPDHTQPYGDVIGYTPGNVDETVGAGEVFVMGDHRDNSRDSRDFGPVASDKLVGKLVARVLPLDDFTRF